MITFYAVEGGWDDLEFYDPVSSIPVICADEVG